MKTFILQITYDLTETQAEEIRNKQTPEELMHYLDRCKLNEITGYIPEDIADYFDQESNHETLH